MAGAAARDHLRHGLVDAAMQRIIEMIRLDQRAGAFHRPVVGQDRAQQSLLDIDVVRDVAIGFLFHKLFSCSSTSARGASNQAIAEGPGKAVRHQPTGA